MVSAAQPDLFRKSSEPEGFRYRNGVVAPAEEQRLASQIADLPLKEFLFQGFVAKRRVMSFGGRYDFERARFEKTDEIPVFEDVIGFSLLSACTFRFRRKHGAKWERHSLQAEPRSICLMPGPSAGACALALSRAHRHLPH
jgi:hypothetical protein